MIRAATRKTLLYHTLQSPAEIGGLKLWLDFSDKKTMYTDDGTTNVVNDGDRIYRVNDKSGNGFNAVQTTEEERPEYKIGIKNGLSVCNYDVGTGGAGTGFDFSGITDASLSHTFVFVYDTSTGVSKRIFDSQTGRLLINVTTVTTNAITFYESAFRDVGTQSGEWQINSFVLNAASGIGELYINGLYSGVGAYAGTAIGGTTTLGGRYNAVATDEFVGYLGEFMIFNSALSIQDRQKLEQYINSKWNMSL